MNEILKLKLCITDILRQLMILSEKLLERSDKWRMTNYMETELRMECWVNGEERNLSAMNKALYIWVNKEVVFTLDKM